MLHHKSARREALSARGADPLLDGAVHGVAPTHCQRLVFGTAALAGPRRAVAIGADGQSAAGIAEPERYDAVVGLLATIGQRRTLRRAAGGIVVGPAIGLGRR